MSLQTHTVHCEGGDKLRIAMDKSAVVAVEFANGGIHTIVMDRHSLIGLAYEILRTMHA